MILDQLMIREDIVIDEEDVIARCLTNSDVARGRCTRLGLFEDLEVGVGCRFLTQNILRLVRRIIVNNQNFVNIAADGLLLNPVNRAGQRVRSVQSWNDNTNSAHVKILLKATTGTVTFHSDGSSLLYTSDAADERSSVDLGG